MQKTNSNLFAVGFYFAFYCIFLQIAVFICKRVVENIFFKFFRNVVDRQHITICKYLSHKIPKKN